MKELIERLRYPVLCTLTDRIEAADALERLTAERNELRAKYDEVEAAAAEAESCMHYRGVELERLTAEKMNLAADIVEIATLRDKLLGDRNAEIERLTSHDQFLADANKQWIADCARLTAELVEVKVERDALKAALQLIKANTNTLDWPDDINAAIQGAGK